MIGILYELRYDLSLQHSERGNIFCGKASLVCKFIPGWMDVAYLDIENCANSGREDTAIDK